jgi:hypothetical protein
MKRIAMIAGLATAGVCFGTLFFMFWAWVSAGFVMPVHSVEGLVLGLWFVGASGLIGGGLMAQELYP